MKNIIQKDMEYLATILPESLLKNYKFDLHYGNQNSLFKSNHAIISTMDRFNQMLNEIQETSDFNTIQFVKKQIKILDKMANALIEPMKQSMDNMVLWISVKDKPFQCWYSYNPKLSAPFKSKLGLI
jgi:hypothetical protein